MFKLAQLIGLAFFAVVPGLAPASAGILDSLFQSKSFPQCDDVKVLGNIVERFNWAEENTWQRGVYMEDINRPDERVEQGERVSEIPRRYCRASARLTNGSDRVLHYLIEGGQGFAGNSFNVEYCISGYDRWNEFDGWCRHLRY